MTTDFKASQVQTHKIIVTGTFAGDGSNQLLIYSKDADDSGSPNQGVIDLTKFDTSSGIGSDVFLFVSGGISTRGAEGSYGVTVIGGDLHVSGNLTVDGSSPGGGGGGGGNEYWESIVPGEIFATGTLAAITGSLWAQFLSSSNGLQITGAFTHGTNSSASSTNSHAQGDGTNASGNYSHAEGGTTTALGDGSHAEGVFTNAVGHASHAEGDGTSAAGFGSHAEGYLTVSTGIYSHAEGDGTESVGDGSHAEGQYTYASGSYSHAEGQYTYTSGSFSHAEGIGTLSSGTYSHAEGYFATGSGNFSHAEGDRSVSWGISSHAEGERTVSSGSSSHSEGYQTIALGNYSHAEGSFTLASGNESHAEGSYTLASSNGSHAEGYLTTASSPASHAEGGYTWASGDGSHTEGLFTLTFGTGSHAEGLETIAVGDYSHAEGLGTIASGTHQHVQGQYNKRGNDFSLFVIGDGTSDADVDRSDIVRVNSGTLPGLGSFEVTGTVRSTLGFSGSLTQLTDGTPYLIAGSGIQTATGSNGAVTISTSGPSGLATGKQYVAPYTTTTSTTAVLAGQFSWVPSDYTGLSSVSVRAIMSTDGTTNHTGSMQIYNLTLGSYLVVDTPAVSTFFEITSSIPTLLTSSNLLAGGTNFDNSNTAIYEVRVSGSSANNTIVGGVEIIFS